MSFWLAYLALGAAVGFIAGLLGIGGGAIIIAFLLAILAPLNFPSTHLMHVALGTSLACILFGSASSLRAHHGHGAVNWKIVRALTPGILVGGFLATFIAARLSGSTLKLIFAAFLFYAAANLFLNLRPAATRELPGRLGMSIAGATIGAISSLVGIGGAAMSIPFMTWCNVNLRTAIGTSAAIGFPVALFGTLGFIINGWHVEGMPKWSLGFVYLPALLGVSVTSIATAPLGAKLAHRLPVATLQKTFGVVLATFGSWMLYGEFFR
jgi:uncharacterized protein